MAGPMVQAPACPNRHSRPKTPPMLRTPANTPPFHLRPGLVSHPASSTELGLSQPPSAARASHKTPIVGILHLLHLSRPLAERKALHTKTKTRSTRTTPLVARASTLARGRRVAGHGTVASDLRDKAGLAPNVGRGGGGAVILIASSNHPALLSPTCLWLSKSQVPRSRRASPWRCYEPPRVLDK